MRATYNNCGSSTVQPKVQKVCFSEKKKKKQNKEKGPIRPYAPTVAADRNSSKLGLMMLAFLKKNPKPLKKERKAISRTYKVKHTAG